MTVRLSERQKLANKCRTIALVKAYGFDQVIERTFLTEDSARRFANHQDRPVRIVAISGRWRKGWRWSAKEYAELTRRTICG